MSLDPWFLFLSMIPSGIGFVLFVYGKKYTRVPHMTAGVLLMVSPYFVSTVTSLLAVETVIGAAFWYALRSGW